METVALAHPSAPGNGHGALPVLGMLAAIDIGTNSVHMVVARVGEGHTFEVVDRVKEMVRLGSSGGDMKRLEADAMDRGVAALARFRSIAEASRAPITAVATSAVREAANAEQFIARARREAGVDVQVISGFEEARLIHLGVLQALPVFERRHLMLDIGGGSTEFVVGDGRHQDLVRSLKLGAIRLTHRFFAGQRTSADQVEAARRYIGAMLAPMVRVAEAAAPVELAVGASGTIESMVAVALADRGEDAPRSMNGVSVSRKEIRRVVKGLIRAETVEERRQIPGLEARRADIILAGGLILEQVMESFDLEALTFSDFALREGVLLDAIERARGSARHHLHDLRRRSVLHLVELCDDDPDHSAHVAELALALFDGVADELELGAEDRELLEAAALLCNIGLFISHAQHHKHSYYVIRNSEHLLGFTDREIELIALVARYHRKSAPKAEHREFGSLDGDDQAIVSKLAGILRVALALDRGHTGAVAALDVTMGPEAALVSAHPATADHPLELELYTANERKALLEGVLDRPVEVAVAHPARDTARIAGM
jgi:exopolyphosphatase / guanosine-5'-triphosphate,3'-diphosphate pyrophosphatase